MNAHFFLYLVRAMAVPFLFVQFPALPVTAPAWVIRLHLIGRYRTSDFCLPTTGAEL